MYLIFKSKCVVRKNILIMGIVCSLKLLFLEIGK